MMWPIASISLSIAATLLVGQTAFAIDVSSRRVIDASTGADNSTVLDSNGRLAIGYYDANDQDLELWVDDGRGGGTAGNGIADGTEIRTIDSAGIVGRFASVTLDFSGRLAISYYDETNEDLKLWYDDGRGGGTAGNGLADGTEIRTLDSADTVGDSSAITVDSNGRLAISYTYSSGAFISLRLWVDDGLGGGTAGNGVADGTEIRTIDATPGAGAFSSITVDSNDRLAISYFQGLSSDLKVWVDDGRGGGTAGNGVADGTEVRTIDSTGFVGLGSSITTDSNGRLAVSYQDTISADLKLWVDDGRGGGTAGNGVADGTEIRLIDSAAFVGAATAATFDSNGRLAIGYLDQVSNQLKLWLDDGRGGGTAGNGVADGTEIRILETAGFPIAFLSITLDSTGRLVVTSGDSFILKLATLVEYGALVLDPSFSVDTSLTLDSNGRLAVSYADGTDEDLELWVDDGRGSGGIAGNRVVDGTEIRTLDSTNSVGEFTSITLDSNDRLAVSYFDRTNGDLKLWVDDGRGSGGVAGNGIADGTEIRVIESTGDVGLYTSIVLDSNNQLAISYYDASNGDLKLWLDDGRGGGTAGNGVADGTEIRTLDSTDDVGALNSITLDSSNRLAVSYMDLTNEALELWLDDGRGGGTAGNGVADGTEIRTIDSTGSGASLTSIGLDSGGRLAISYFDGTNDDLKLWVDDGLGGGTASNGISDGTEIRTIDSTGAVGFDSSITLDSGGRLAISYYDFTNFDLKLWIDDGSGSGGVAGNGVADGTEVRTADSTGNVGRFSSIALDSNNELVVAFGAFTLKLFGQTRNFPDLDARGNGIAITNGDSTPSSSDDTDFGSQLVSSGSITKVFTLENLGGEPLVLGNDSVSLSGPGASDYTITAAPRPILRSGKPSTFTIVFDPSVAGQRTATVSIANSTLNETPFTFAISGNGEQPTPAPTGTAAPTTTATPTPAATATATPTVVPTVSATATPGDPSAQLFRLRVIRRDPQQGLGALRLSTRNATTSSIGVRSCLPVKRFNDDVLRDYFLVLRNQDSTQRRRVRVRRSRACGEFTIRRRGTYRIRFEQVFGDSVARASEHVLFRVE